TPPHAGLPLAVRVQPRQLRAATACEPGALCLRPGAGPRNRPLAPGTAPPRVVKLACVVQRYGAGIAGGSERHCRELALRLSARHDVSVLTTCAVDYVTWDNELPAGTSVDGAVRVHRFPVRRS